MKLAVHVLIVLLLCLAAGWMIVRFAQLEVKNVGLSRAVLLLLGIGFLAGGIYQAISAPACWVFSLYLLGAYLSYTALLFSFPGKEAQHE